MAEMTELNPVIKLSLEASKILLTRNISEDKEYNNWPSDSDEKTSSNKDISKVCERILKETRSGIGFSIIKLDLDTIRYKHQITMALWNLFTCFAEPIAQFRNGYMLHRVQKSYKSPPPRCSYSLSDKLTDIHTDGSYLHKSPHQYIGLICIHQANVGGESILVDGRKVFEKLKMDYPNTIHNLKQDYHFYTDNQVLDTKTLTKPIIAESDLSLTISYHRNHIKLGHKEVGLPLSPGNIKSMDKFDHFLNQKEYQYRYKLSRGEMLTINNHIILHGRNSFKDDTKKKSKRLMMRLWGNPRI